MGEVTIDSIQIEIESNSTNASKGLDALAGSLEKLKKNGSFKTVSTNLNNLSAALKNLPNVHSASNALRTLEKCTHRFVDNILFPCYNKLNQTTKEPHP